MLTNKSILITGAGGFIGSHLTETLLENGNQLILIDNFNDYYTGKEEQLNAILNKYDSKNFRLIKGDLLHKKILDGVNSNVEVIFHLAAQAGVRYSLNNAAEVAQNNIVSTVNIFEFGRICNRIEKIVFASSSSVYGNPIYTPLDEEHPKNPISPYAVSKLCGEHYADYYYREYDLPITSLRFYTVYGPRGRPDMAIRKFFEAILKEKEIVIYGDGTQLRDFTHVSDIVNGLILSAEKDNSNGQVFNLGCSNPISVNDLVEKLYAIAQKTKKLKFVEKQKGDVDVTYSNTEKAKKLLAYVPKVQIDQGLKTQFEWQRKILSN
ncbi:MAG: GDP-mannose 4,6-dehydratase [Candidatus Lokiarchaeota archaeon]|nr:GDP-mannose 4,6-dehydratase [Candidatus Lokiarchaeota archaeon]